MSATPKQTVQTGTVNGTPIIIDLYGNSLMTAGADPWALKRVTLSQNYVAINPPGFPDRPPAGQEDGNVWKAGTVTSGTQRYFHAHEAAALVAAGAAAYS